MSNNEPEPTAETPPSPQSPPTTPKHGRKGFVKQLELGSIVSKGVRAKRVLDEQYQEDLRKEKEMSDSHIPDFKNRALGCFSPTNRFRRLMMLIAYNKHFNWFIIFCIILNCIFLAIGNPACQKLTSTEAVEKDTRCTSEDVNVFIVSEIAGWFFTIIFTLESVIKIFAMGFIRDKNTYLRDAWNWLDFIVVVIAWISVLPGVSNLSSLRTFRVLRPLRTLSTIPGMKTIIKSIMASCKQLANVLMLWVFVFMLFGIIGLQLFSGVFAGRCYLIKSNSTGNEYILDVIDEQLCGLKTSNEVTCDTITTTCKPVFQTRICEPVYYGTPGTRDPVTGTSKRMCRRAPQSEKPNYGFSNFDNILYGALTVFTSITLEGWVDVLYNLQDSFGHGYIVVPYFIFLILFGSYFLVNLALAVIWQEYDSTSKEEKAKKARKEAIQATSETAEETAHRKEGKPPVLPKPCLPSCLSITKLVLHPVFEGLITGFIILNTVGLALDMHPMPDGLEPVLTVANLIFSGIFFIEMVLKLIGLGPRAYVQDAFNIFDMFVVILSMIEIIIVYGVAGTASGLSVFRTFRLFRVFKLIRSWTSLRILMTLILNSLIKVSTAGILLLIVMFIFALLGMQLYAGEFTPELFDEKPRAHFDNLFWSFVTVFQVLTGENWNEVLYDGMKVNGIISVIFFLTLTFVGNYIIFNLFLAILLEQFDQSGDEDSDVEEESSKSPRTSPSKSAKVAPSERKTPEPNSSAKVAPAPSSIANSPRATSPSLVDQQSIRRASIVGQKPTKRSQASNLNEAPSLTSSSCFVFSRTNVIRKAAYSLVLNKWFDRLILCLIGLSSIMLAIDEPPLRECVTQTCIDVKKAMEVVDFIVTVCFILEMLLKWLAFGIIFHKGSYFRDWWNNLDGSLVILSIIGMILSPPFSDAGSSVAESDQGTLKALRSLRALRGLRPLRVVRRYPGLKLVVNSIIRAIPKIANVVFVTLFFLLIFAIVGVQNYKGQMNACNDVDVSTKAECVGNFFLKDATCSMAATDALENACYMSSNGTLFPRKWEPMPYNFDNIGNAMTTVFEVTSGEMWPDIMYSVVDTAGIDEPAVVENRPASALLFILMIFFCSFLMFNVFVGVVIDNFNKMKEEQEGMDLLTAGQRHWRQTMLHTLRTNPMSVLRPPLNHSKWRQSLFIFVEDTRFELGIMLCIMINVAVMALRYDGMPYQMEVTLDTVNFIFVGIFTLEAILKIVGIGFMGYVALKWNQFDFTLVIMSYVGIVGGGSLGSVTTLFRIVRTARLFRLIKMSEGLTDLFNTLMIALPQVANVMTLLMLVFFIYAVIGMNLFSSVRLNGGLNSHANFQTFGSSFLMLFRMATGESYNELMHNLQITEPYCSEREGNCGPPGFPTFYCISFFTISSFVLLNLLVAIVIEAFTTITELNNGKVRPSHTAEFKKRWAVFDPDGDSMVPTTMLIDLMVPVPYPLGLQNPPGGGTLKEAQVRKEIESMFLERREDGTFLIPVYHHPPLGEANFHEFLTALVNRAMGDVQGDAEVEDFAYTVQHTITQKTTETFVKSVRSSTPKASRKSKAQLREELANARGYYIGEVFAAQRIQKLYRNFKDQKRREHMGQPASQSDERN